MQVQAAVVEHRDIGRTADLRRLSAGGQTFHDALYDAVACGVLLEDLLALREARAELERTEAAGRREGERIALARYQLAELDAAAAAADIHDLAGHGPLPFTGEDVVEIGVHGGSVVARRVLEAVLATGARLAERGEFTRRAFLNGRLDLTQVEAVAEGARSLFLERSPSAVSVREIAAAAATLPPDVVAAAQERGRTLDLWATAEELLAERLNGVVIEDLFPGMQSLESEAMNLVSTFEYMIGNHHPLNF